MKFKKIKQGEADFLMSDGIKIIPRACLEISEDCSPYMKNIISEASQRGWLKSIAYVKETDFMWEELAK